MPIDLTRPASEVTTDTASPYRPLLTKLQGNILKSHGRNIERHVFLKFKGPPAAVRAWIKGKIANRVLTAAAQFDQARQREANPAFDGGGVTLFFLTAEGYRFLGLNAQLFDSRAFRKGMKDQGDSLPEDVFSTGNKDPKPVRWETGYRHTIHAMVQLGDDNEARLKGSVATLQAELTNIADILAIESGRALRRTVDKGKPTERVEPIEHFGYFDGISQPIFTKPDLDKYYAEKKGTKGAGKWDPIASLDLVLTDDPFTAEVDAYGSYLVYRKLHQNVGQWDDRVGACAQDVGHPPDLIGAMAIGRFRDGTPVVNSSTPTAKYTNDFVFKTADPKGFRCPAHAHARKVNPRGTTPSTSEAAERRRRIARRGIPYGKPVPNICDAVETDPNKAADRGLLFMCFQANVERQFEFIQRTWCDNPNFPDNVLNIPFSNDTGDDPLIGQDNNEKQRWPKKWGDEAAGRDKFNFESPVTFKGGEYFFAPSKPFLASL